MNNRGICVTSSGREVFLTSLRMDWTFRGLLASSPESVTEDWRLNGNQWFIDIMRHEFKYVEAAIVIDEGWPKFPSYQWIGLFEGEVIHSRDMSWEWKSRLSVCWFSHTLPSNFNEMIAEVTRKVVWEDIAEDFDASP